MRLRERVLSQLEGIDYVSFDIYDTLLFRMVRFPSQIFEKTYEKAPELFPDYIVSCEWEQIRIYAEKYAKEKKNSEVLLSDIYAEFPQIIEEPDKIMKMELETERENSFLNPEIARLLCELKTKYEKKVILTSDMYLSEKELRKILKSSGLNLALVDEVFVSSAYGIGKSSGKLYKYISEKLHCMPEQFLHIGDNWTADYINAKKAGWKSVYYPLISEAEYRYPYLGYERECYGDIGREIYAMRILAADCHDEKGKEKEWFEMGAMTMGPLFTYAAEWVLDQAEKYNIRNIYPMMREGHFLTVLLKNAAKERGWKGHIEPMYISRRALYPALYSVLKKRDVESVLSAKYTTVKEAVELFGLDGEEWSGLKKYYSYSMEDCRNIFENGVSIEQRIRDYLINDDTIHKMHTEHKQADEELWEYFVGLKMDQEDYITFDVGWKGSTQNAIERITKRRKAVGRGLHFLVIGRNALLKSMNLEEGADIRGFASNFGGNFRVANNVREEIFEIFLMCQEGTTEGYQLEGKEIHPIGRSVGYKEYQIKSMEAAQKGILSFQKLYFSLKGCSKKIVKQDKEDLLKIAARLTTMPTKKEAKLIGSMACEKNLAVDGMWTIIDKEGLKQYKQLGYSEFIQNGARPIEWYQGMDAVLDGLVHYKWGMFRLREEAEYQCAMYAERICRRFKRFVLVGAGQRARTLFIMLNLMDETDRIEFVVDNDRYLQGEFMHGKEICPLNRKSSSGCYVITAMKRTAVRELRKQLKAMDENNVIYDIYSREEKEV